MHSSLHGKRHARKGLVAATDVDTAGSDNHLKGEFLVILGASGAGKSTLLRCINHLTEPTTGEITVDGVQSRGDRAGLRRVRRDVAMIFQHYNVVPRLSVLKNVLTGRLSAMPAVLSWFQMFPQDDIKIARDSLRRDWKPDPEG